jgi:hypothetical protein
LQLHPSGALRGIVFGGFPDNPAHVIRGSNGLPRRVVLTLEIRPIAMNLAQRLVSAGFFVNQRGREADTVFVGQFAYRRTSCRAGEMQVEMRLWKRPQFAHHRSMAAADHRAG